MSSATLAPNPNQELFSKVVHLRTITMTLRSHFFLFLLLFSFLQPWRLAASTPDAEDFFKHVTEEGVRLVDEVIEEEDSVSHQPLLNIEQTTVQTDIHSITPSVECAPTSHEGSSNSASSISSLFPSSTSNLPSSTAVAIPPAFSLYSAYWPNSYNWRT